MTTPVVTMSSSGFSGSQQSLRVPVSGPHSVVDNRTNAYMVWVTWTVPNNASDIRIFNTHIEYTVASLP